MSEIENEPNKMLIIKGVYITKYLQMNFYIRCLNFELIFQRYVF